MKQNNNNNKVYSSEENSIFFNALSFQLNALKEVNLNAKWKIKKYLCLTIEDA